MAGAADLSARPAATALPAGSWTGFYLGVHAGAGLTSAAWGDATGPLGASEAQNFPVIGNAGAAIGGGQIGYNQQIGSYVLGVELDASFGQLTGLTRCANGWQSICSDSTDALGTLAARLGYAFDNVLVYGKAGGAFARSSLTATGLAYAGQFTGSDTAFGWTVGGGVEVALTPQVSAKAEYAYLDFGSGTAGLSNGALSSAVDVTRSAQLVKVGLNWHPATAPLPGTAPASASGRNWSGLYVGGHAGGAWAGDDWTAATGLLRTVSASGAFPGSGDAQGLFGGGQVGIDYQFGQWVVGAEASASAASIGGATPCASNNRALMNYSCSDTLTAMGTLAGRLGWSLGDALVYGKAGAAWAQANGTAQPTESALYLSQSGTRWGWMAGAGLEYALGGNLSAFVEYDHFDFGTQDLAYAGFGEAATASFKQRLDAVRMGLNYRLAWGEAAGAPAAPRAPALPVGWTAEIGARYFASTGRMQKDLYDPFTPQRLNSRLIYDDTTGQAGEAFFRFDNRNDLFLKGYAGLGTLSGGTLYDEDFPAGPAYSNTATTLRDGHLSYGALDLGYDFITRGRDTLGAFVGYRALYQQANGYGCLQIAQSNVCDAAQQAVFPALISNRALSETELWQGVALGLNSRMALSDRLRLEVDAAYLPYALRASSDNHWFRADINPQTERGHGWGTQMEAVLTYAVTDRFDVGIGGRYWFFATDEASTQFPGAPLRSPQTFYTERYGAFLQASYRFGDLPPPEAAAPGRIAKAPAPAQAQANWTALYAGATLGAGKAHTTYQSPFATPVSGDAVDLGGALAGGQVGADYQMGHLVLGAEAAGAWAHLTGTDTCFSTAPAGENSGFNCGSRVSALGSLTGRLGYAADRVLLYARGGFAWNRQSDSLNTVAFDGGILADSGSNTGWTLGGGIEYALLPNLSVGLEYKHYDFGAASAFSTTVPAALAGVNLAPDGVRIDTVAMNLNWRFTAFDPR
ncbi:outer membrane beta-barrel protein [Azorhizobium doebereinerae]|uniref:outer membrane beta-barrel protein n=1 Tax=Azorhizobium doebereinerae TaxID=281091 RepID=UPI0018DECAA8|nr:outer membrane beta-barrel protein [Azorhizobium doebereinerae]